MDLPKTHTFNGQKYWIDYATSIEGVTDTAEIPEKLEMLLLAGVDFKAFHSAFHEALEGSGFCESCMHKKDGTPNTIDAARFLWRLRGRYEQRSQRAPK